MAHSGTAPSEALAKQALTFVDDLSAVEAIAFYANDAIVVTEGSVEAGADSHRIVYVNPAFERNTGWTAGEIIGQNPRVLQCEETDRDEVKRIVEALNDWRPVRAQLLNQTRLGDRFWVELDIAPVKDGQGWPRFWISVQRDVTERREQELALRKAMAVSVATGRAKDRFLAKMGHELRTPLNAVVGYADLLSQQISGALTDAQLDQVRSIESAADHLLSLINDILEFAKTSKAGVRMDAQWTELAEVIDACVRMNALHAEQKGIALRVEQGPLSARLFCDPTRARQALSNLIVNAIKFSPDGGTIVVRAHAGDGEAVISVADNGPGMTEEETIQALEPFVQLEDDLQKHNPGCGLGLPVTAQLMEMHGGSLNLVSEKGVGTLAELVFPNPDGG